MPATAKLSHWRPRGVPLSPAAPRVLRPWLDEPGSLTQRLRKLAGADLAVEVITAHWARAWPDERRRLGLRQAQRVWVREVLLGRPAEPLVYARSVIPWQSLRGPLRRLRTLGRQPLGSLLFGRYPVVRGPIEIARVTAPSALGQRLKGVGAHGQWARRSVFSINARPLLVTEIFLDALVEELHEHCLD